MSAISGIASSFKKEYGKLPARLKILDVFIVYAILSAAVQFGYLLLAGSFPFNAFLAGFFSSLGFMALTICLRLQVDTSNKDFSHISPERAYADYVLANLVLHLVVWNYIG